MTALYGTEYEVGAASEILCRFCNPFYSLNILGLKHLNMFWTVKSDGNLIILPPTNVVVGTKMFSFVSVC